MEDENAKKPFISLKDWSDFCYFYMFACGNVFVLLL